MSAMANPTESEFSAGLLPVRLSLEAPAVRPAGMKNDRHRSGWRSLGKRAALALARFLITFCIGAAATLAWQTYGDAAREIITNLPPQLGRVAVQAAPAAQNAPGAIVPVAPADPSGDQQQLSAMSLDLNAVRQNVDRIATSQQEMTRTVDQLAADQEQMAREITTLQAISQYILYKSSEPPPRPAPVRVPTPVPRPSQASTAR